VPTPRRVFALLSGGRRFMIVADTMFIEETQLGNLESSLGDLGRICSAGSGRASSIPRGS
jgi:hypothetical protein